MGYEEWREGWDMRSGERGGVGGVERGLWVLDSVGLTSKSH